MMKSTLLPWHHRHVLRVFLLALPLLSGIGCDLSDQKDGRNYIRLQLPETLRRGDSVQVLLERPGDSASPDTLWFGELKSDSGLGKVPAPHYGGGDADLDISAWRQVRENLFYHVRVEYRKGEGKSKVIDRLPPDSLPPALLWEGPDSMDLVELPPDSGWFVLFPHMGCADDRDRDTTRPSLEVVPDSAREGLCWVRYACRDRSGNASKPRSRRVRVLSVVDTVPPTLTLLGGDTLPNWLGRAFDPGRAECTDDKDPAPRLRVLGTADMGRAGYYPILFSCTDAAGNESRRTRIIQVMAGPDSVAPVIALAGPDTMLVVSAAGFVDPGGTCHDEVDGDLPLVRQGISQPVSGPGWYTAGYLCRDKSGNKTVKTRVLKVGLFGASLPVTADAQLDTLDTRVNNGAIAAISFLTQPVGHYFGTIRFDLAKVDRAALKSAKLHFFAFLHGAPYSGGIGTYIFHVYALKSDWVEGTGNWWYFDGMYHNDGETWLQYYPTTDSVKARSTDPAVLSGVNGMSKQMVRDSALIPVATQKERLYFGPSGNPDQIPAPDHLTPVEIDITDFLKNPGSLSTYGFIVKVEGVTEASHMGFTTREAGDGSWATRLMLEY